jgi:NADPH-dependent curcumin reductase CurA
VSCLSGWQRYVALPDDGLATPLGPPEAVDQLAMLAVYGATGLTAYVGIVDVGEVKEGDTVVVSAAAGATGSVAAQIAKIQGARVIGIAGTDEKCAWLTDGLGLDGAINYRTDDVAARLKELCPKRVDVFFDNVGGAILDACLARLANGGRVVLCGAISSYNDEHRPPGPANYLNLIQRRGSMRGFLSLDHWGRFPEVAAVLAGWVNEGKLQYRVEKFQGLEAGVDALNAMFTGTNTGKIVIEV